MVLGRFAVFMQLCTFSLVYQYLQKNYISLDSLNIMLHRDIKYVNMSNGMKVRTRRELRNCNFSYIFLN